MNNEPDPRIIVLTAPSGAGKTTIANRLLDAFPAMRFSVSATTRPKRDNEIHGVHYHFLTQSQFDQAMLDSELLEYEEVYIGSWYGTLRREVEQSSREKPVLLDIDVEGALTVKNTYGDRALVIFVKPPSLEELERRLRKRQSENIDTLKQRLARAGKELGYSDRFDAIVVNDILEIAVEEARRLITDFLNENNE